MMDEHQPTTKQIVMFTVVLSFIVSILGTVLALGTFGTLFGFGSDTGGGPLVFNKPKILEKITETITNRETTEKVIRLDELVVGVVENASPAVVSVVATKDVPVVEQFFVDPFGDVFGDGGSGFQIPQFRQKGTEKQEISSGTGFIVSEDGLIVTNRHVVEDTEAEYTALFNDGSKKSAKVLARDPLQDLAILKIDPSTGSTGSPQAGSGQAGYRALHLGDSSAIKIGQTVIAIGNALGEFRNTVSVGIVSGLQRTVVASGASSGPETLDELIQTDAAINPGNSGGPLLNISGEVIGINTAIARGAENIGFSIPANKIKRSLDSVKQHGKIVYPYIGVRYVTVTQALAEKEKLGKDYGALVRDSEAGPAVVPNSPAARAGLKAGDIILEVNGERIDQDHMLGAIIQKYNIGDEVTLKVFREGKEIEVKIKLEERK